MDTLWPYQGFAVKAFERRLGEGKLTLTKQSFLFEAKTGEMMGFDLPALRLVRLKGVHTVEVVYSVQGELRNAFLRVICTFADGTERDELPSEEDCYRMSMFRAITGGVVARFLLDHGKVKVECLTAMTDEKFEARHEDFQRNLQLFPDKKQYENDVWWDQDLKKRSVEAGRSELQIWDDPYGDRLFTTGANPTATVENAVEKLDILQEDWVNGRLSPLQRAKCVAMDYSVKIRMAEIGYSDDQGGSESWTASAERLVQFERGRLGVDILGVS